MHLFHCPPCRASVTAAAMCFLQGRVDDMLPLALFDVLQTGFMCLGVFVLVAAAVPFILPIFVLLLVIFYYFR